MNTSIQSITFQPPTTIHPNHRHISIIHLNQQQEDLNHFIQNTFNTSLDTLLIGKNPKTKISLIDLLPLISQVENGEISDEMFMLDTELVEGRHFNYMVVVIALSSADLKRYAEVVKVIACGLTVGVPVRIVVTDGFSEGKRDEILEVLKIDNQNVVFGRLSSLTAFYADVFFGLGAVDYLMITSVIVACLVDGDSLIVMTQDNVLRFIDWRSGDIIDVIDFYDTTIRVRTAVYSSPSMAIDNQEAMLYICMASPVSQVYVVDLMTHEVVKRAQIKEFYRVAIVGDNIIFSTSQDNLSYDEETEVLLIPSFLYEYFSFDKFTGECTSRLFLEAPEEAQNRLEGIQPSVLKYSGDNLRTFLDLNRPRMNEGKVIGAKKNKIRVHDALTPNSFQEYHPRTNYSYKTDYVAVGRKYCAYKHLTKNLITVRDLETRKTYKISSLPKSFHPEFLMIKDEYLFLKAMNEIRVINILAKMEISRIADICSAPDPSCCIQ